jgi:hypothetical protein
VRSRAYRAVFRIFLHMLVAAPRQASAGTTITTLGAILLAVAVLFPAHPDATAPRT